ncbi:hypothetical protein [uncultured Corynebacterium sp.]|nr:hypothetical protein [uncultured Corynebacterium sp.]
MTKRLSDEYPAFYHDVWWLALLKIAGVVLLVWLFLVLLLLPFSY